MSTDQYTKEPVFEHEPDDVFSVVFDDPPGPVCGRFIEVEDHRKYSIDLGRWEQDGDYHRLVLSRADLEKLLEQHAARKRKTSQTDPRIACWYLPIGDGRVTIAVKIPAGLSLDGGLPAGLYFGAAFHDPNDIHPFCRAQGRGIALERIQKYQAYIGAGSRGRYPKIGCGVVTVSDAKTIVDRVVNLLASEAAYLPHRHTIAPLWFRDAVAAQKVKKEKKETAST